MSEPLSIEPSDIYETPLLVEVGGFADHTQGGPHVVPEGGHALMSQ
ncbi:lasso RiPP family leader peptide-containing protein [Solihabitans fulvus]|nr:lasso RiPP family leader peptide-containing protein [Solihabitans fulvus]